jgi:hypothetical protein
MKHKMMLLALAAVSAALFALPAMASAAEWDIDAETANPITFKTTSGEAKLTSNGFGAFAPVVCASSSGEGTYTNQTTATSELTFTGCVQGSNKCHTSGFPEGTITTTTLTSHNIMIDNTAQVAGGTPGLLLTPNSGHFATFTCGGSTYVVNGSTAAGTGAGIIGDITTPKCGGAFSKTATVKFETTSSGVQKYMQEETGVLNSTKYDLVTKSPLGSFTSGEDATGTITFNQGTKMTCP